MVPALACRRAHVGRNRDRAECTLHHYAGIAIAEEIAG